MSEDTQEAAQETEAEESLVPPRPDRALPWLAALSAARLRYRVVETPEETWEIRVPAAHAARAREELAEYERVNRDWPPPPSPAAQLMGLYDAKAADTGIPAFLLLAFFLFSGPFDRDVPLFALGCADSTRILAGEWWRAITALTLHADLPHVLGNTACWFAFGAAVCGQIGLGVGWLLVLATGFFGNLAAAAMHGAGHSAVGGSTASFGALGLLSALQLFRNLRLHGNVGSVWSRTWVPLAAGTALLALLGVGPRADLAAHLCGFVAGLALGALALPLLTHHVSKRWQVILFVLTAALIGSAWHLALTDGVP